MKKRTDTRLVTLWVASTNAFGKRLVDSWPARVNYRFKDAGLCETRSTETDSTQFEETAIIFYFGA